MKCRSAQRFQILGVVLLAALSLIFFVSGLIAQPTPVRWSIKADPSAKTLKAVSKFSVQVTAQIAEGWYFYSITQPKGGPIRTTFSMPKVQPFRLVGTIKGPKPKIKFDDNFDINVESYEGSAVFMVPVRVVRAKPGKQKLHVSVRFQACNGEICLSPRTDNLELEVDLF